MKQLLTDIQSRLAAATAADGGPLFAHVDLDWGQVDFYSGMPPVGFPCALVDVQSATYANAGNRAQIATVAVRLRVVDLILSPTSSPATAQQRERAARVFDLLHQAHRLLHGWTGTPSSYGRLVRTALARARRRDGLHEYTLTFETAITDDSAAPQPLPANITPVVIA
jgi:hypothetical protein